MKGIQLGYDQLDNGEKIYAKIPLSFYGKFIDKITKQNIPGEKTFLKFYKYSSSSGNKYAFKFKNFFYFKLNQETLNNNNKKRTKQNNIIDNNNSCNNKTTDEKKLLEPEKIKEEGKTGCDCCNNNNNTDDIKEKIYRLNVELSKKSKIINCINFEMNPLLKLSLNNLIKFKYGCYQGSSHQPVLFNNIISNNKEQYDFSSVFPSMIPYKRIGVSFNKNFYSSTLRNMHNLKLSYNKILNYESNIKISNILKSNYIFNFQNFCNILFSNELTIKKSFVFFKKQIIIIYFQIII